MRLTYRYFLFLTICTLLLALPLAMPLQAFAGEEPADTTSEEENASTDEEASAESSAETRPEEGAPLEEVQQRWRQELLRLQKWDLTLEHLGYAAGTFVLLWIAVMITRSILRRIVVSRGLERRRESGRMIQRFLLVVLHKTSKTGLFIVILFLALQWLRATDAFVGKPIVTLTVIYQVALYASGFARSYLNAVRVRRGREDPSRVSSFGILSLAAQVAVWSLALLVALQNLGFEITALIAGLGIGGIAIAFALQNILGDIFCSVAIVLDKPFGVGDFIIVGDQAGVVENIGIKTTRVRSLWGEQSVFSNADLTNSRIRNYKRMEERRITFALGVTYETPVEKLERIPAIIRETIASTSMTRFDRAHFKEYGDFSLNFEVVYYVLSPDYNTYMDIQQTINLAIFRRFTEEGIDFAYPTQELIIRPNSESASSAPETPRQA